MDDTEVRQKLLGAANRDGERLVLSCERALRLATELGVDVRRIGAICQAEAIKIVDCQLGCFGGRRRE